MGLRQRLLGGGVDAAAEAAYPEALARRRRPGPSRDATLSFRLPLGLRMARGLFRGLARWPLGWRLELVGAERLPRDARGRVVGGWIGAGMPHVTWVEPFLIFMLLPPEPRLVWIGDGRAIYRSPLRRLLFERLGGVIPIWPGGGPAAFADHVALAGRVIENGAVLVIFPEVGPPAAHGQARPLSPGLMYLALRTGAPLVPLVCGGTDDLFRGRRLRLEVLEPTTPAELAGLPAGPAPEPGTSAERSLARRSATALHDRTAAAVDAATKAVEPPAGARRSWPWLTHLLH